jgi:hypothetical protein
MDKQHSASVVHTKWTKKRSACWIFFFQICLWTNNIQLLGCTLIEQKRCQKAKSCFSQLNCLIWVNTRYQLMNNFQSICKQLAYTSLPLSWNWSNTGLVFQYKMKKFSKFKISFLLVQLRKRTHLKSWSLEVIQQVNDYECYFWLMLSVALCDRIY